MADSQLRIHPSVDAVIKPIIQEMTRIWRAKQYDPNMIGVTKNENEFIKEKKKECVHLIYDTDINEYRMATKRDKDNGLICEACDREINTKFDESAVKTLTDAVKVVNQLLLFGMVNGLRAEPIAALISLKKMLPAAAQLLKELNEYVARDNKASESTANIGDIYGPGAFRSISSYR